MKLMSLYTASILLSVSLTSCRPQTEKPAEVMAPVERAVKASNIIYLDKEVTTRAQDGQTVFNNLIATGNVVVDFYAHWCGPCKAMGTTIDQIADQFPSIIFLKVDTDQFRTIGADVQSIPTLVFYKNGTKLTRFSGAKDKNSFKALLLKWY